MKRSPFRKRPARNPLPAEVRDAVLERDNWACQPAARGLTENCWGDLQAHHIIRRSQGGTHDPSNLLSVCASCHLKIHTNPAWAVEHGLLARRSAA